MIDPQTQNKIVETLQRFWKEKIKSEWHGQQDCMCHTVSVVVRALTTLVKTYLMY
jgi:hypothetical protein